MNQFDVGTKIFIDDVEYEVYDTMHELGIVEPVVYYLMPLSAISIPVTKAVSPSEMLWYSMISNIDYTIRHERIE